MTVVPLANAAAISRLSVAVWLGYSRTTRAPTRRPPGTVPRTSPCEDSKRAPIAVSPLMWKSIGRSPKSSPPGSGMRTVPQRAISRPNTTTDARIFSKSSGGAAGIEGVGGRGGHRQVAVVQPLDRAPNPRSTSAMVSTSLMHGTLESTERPSASRQATISLSAEFFAPPAVTVPESGPPASTTIWSPRVAGLCIALKYRRLAATPRPPDGDPPPTMVTAVVTPKPTPRQAPDRNLAMDLVRTTEAAAMAASRWMGRGDKIGADGAAVEAMRTVLGHASPWTASS